MNISITFGLITFAWIFFRAENVEQAFSYISRILNPTIMSIPNLNKAALATIILIGFLLIIEWIGREDNFALEKLFVNSNIAGEGNYQLVRWSFYAFIILLIGLFMQTNETPFIYFQF